MRSGRFSRWHPGLYDGFPLYAESQAGYWHPLKFVLYPWLSTWQALNLDTILSVWLTGLATYGWLRRHVGASGALTGAALVRPERVRLGAPDPHEHDQRPDQRPAGVLGPGAGLGRGAAPGGRAGGAGPGLPGLRRALAGHDPDRRGARDLGDLPGRSPRRASGPGSRRSGSSRPWEFSAWRSRPCSGSPRRTCSTARLAKGA